MWDKLSLCATAAEERTQLELLRAQCSDLVGSARKAESMDRCTVTLSATPATSTTSGSGDPSAIGGCDGLDVIGATNGIDVDRIKESPGDERVVAANGTQDNDGKEDEENESDGIEEDRWTMADLDSWAVPTGVHCPALALFDPVAQQRRVVFRSKQPVLTEQECARVVDIANAFHAEHRGGSWGTVRHSR